MFYHKKVSNDCDSGHLTGIDFFMAVFKAPAEAARAVKTPTASSAAPGHRQAGKRGREVGFRQGKREREGGGGVGVVSAPTDKGASSVAGICARSWHLNNVVVCCCLVVLVRLAELLRMWRFIHVLAYLHVSTK